MKKLYAFLAAAAVAMTASAADVYMIGGFNGWTLADPACKMTETTPNVYTLHLDNLISGFKFNDGTWSNAEMNIGGGLVNLDVPTPVEVGGSSGNLGFASGMSVENANITLDLNAMTVLVSGRAVWEDGKWDLAGSFDWSPWDSNSYVFEKYDEGLFKQQMTFTGEDIEIKVSTANWIESYGLGAESQSLAMGQFSTGVLQNNSQENIHCTLVGTWWMNWDYNQLILSATSTEPVGGVEAIAADDNTEAVYYNLQGVRVNNPANGLYIVKRGNQVSKAYIF
ncbi:MAG: hypothetical protein K2L93_05595 [Muribaculaceae bacterium]|nr:hypothetical protein [Muribaculaceae bacterium]